MQTMKAIPLPTQERKNYLTMLFLEVNKKKHIFGFLCVFM